MIPAEFSFEGRNYCQVHAPNGVILKDAIIEENILEEANRITSGDRRKEYGSVKESFERISKLWSVILGIEVTPMQVCLCMIQLKIARQMNGYKRDSLVDIAGYARTGEMLHE